MYDFDELQTKLVQNAIALAERCGVSRQYAENMIVRGDFDLSRYGDNEFPAIAAGIIRDYNGTYATPDNPQPASWAQWRREKKKTVLF